MNTLQILRPMSITLALLAGSLSLSLSLGCGSCDAPTSTTQAPAVPQPTSQTSSQADDQADGQAASGQIILDGSFDDWSTTNTAIADARYLSIRFSPKPDSLASIQAAPYTTRIRLNTDLDASTGRPMEWMSVDASIQQPQGVELLIELSPPNEQGEIGIGSAVTRYNQDAQPTDIGHAGIGFAFLPTYQSPSYELRIDRRAPGAHGLLSAGKVEIVIDQVDEQGKFLWSTTIFANLPALEEPQDPEVTIPNKPAASVRIMSANVLFSSPLENPAPFARILSATAPDIILYQEWFNTPADQVQAWLDTHAGPNWHIHMPNAKAGVAIASRLPIIKAYESVIPSSGNDRPARAVAALIQTDAGELLTISLHLKCCGSADSDEDNKRVAQAQAINNFVRQVHQNHPQAKVVIAGDFNLVGSYKPMTEMVRSLGAQGNNLSTIEAKLLGDHSTITWNDEKSRFSPGRLDWILIDESTSHAQHSFVLDTRSIPLASLESMKLEPDDSKASDHLPIVIDLIEKP